MVVNNSCTRRLAVVDLTGDDNNGARRNDGVNVGDLGVHRDELALIDGDVSTGQVVTNRGARRVVDRLFVGAELTDTDHLGSSGGSGGVIHDDRLPS